MRDYPTDELIHYRTEIERRWREVNELCIDLYLRAHEDSDLGTVAEISGRFDSIAEELESPLRAPTLYDDLIAMFS